MQLSNLLVQLTAYIEGDVKLRIYRDGSNGKREQKIVRISHLTPSFTGKDDVILNIFQRDIDEAEWTEE